MRTEQLAGVVKALVYKTGLTLLILETDSPKLADELDSCGHTALDVGMHVDPNLEHGLHMFLGYNIQIILDSGDIQDDWYEGKFRFLRVDEETLVGLNEPLFELIKTESEE